MLDKNTIPVLFMGGTGGNFLSSFISCARDNDFEKFELDSTGHAHASKKRDVPLFSPDGVHITIETFMKLYDSMPRLDKVVYPACHFSNPHLVLNIFNKAIKIYVEPNDYNEVAVIFLKKNKYWSREAKEYHINQFNQFYDLSHCVRELEPRLLNVSWKELVHLDESILINKLSEFTLIPCWQFNTDMLAQWRSLTLANISN